MSTLITILIYIPTTKNEPGLEKYKKPREDGSNMVLFYWDAE